MKRREYSAGAVKFSFWFMEFRKVTGILAEGKSLDNLMTFYDIHKVLEEIVTSCAERFGVATKTMKLWLCLR